MAFNMVTRSRDIIRRRLILGQTLEQIGQHYGLTRERVRQTGSATATTTATT